MLNMRIVPEGDGQFPELREAAREGRLIESKATMTITGLAAGMASGKPSVAIIIELPDGRVLFAETSLALFLSAADALRARHGDPRHE